MDGTTEPIIAVIGHPIAGNPTQFAIERALRSIDMDWRVLSFDVQPKDIATALDGFAVTGIAGVIIDPSVRDEASTWYSDRMQQQAESSQTDTSPETLEEGQTPADEVDDAPIETSLIDCLYRDDERRFVGSYEQRAWVDDMIAQHNRQTSAQEDAPIAQEDAPIQAKRIWLGEQLDDLPLSHESLSESPIPLPPEPEVIESADVIILAGEIEAGLETEEWPTDDGSTLIIDLTDGHADQPTMKRLGYRVVTEMERRIGTLQRCLDRWTGNQVSADVIQDAIEEYLGV